MQMHFRSTHIALFFLGVFSLGFVSITDSVRLDYFRVNDTRNDYSVAWQSSEEEGVRSYEVHRKSSSTNNKYALIGTVEAQGPGHEYVVKDTQLFKNNGELIEYRLQVVYQSGARQILAARTVNFTSTAVRRTWGSIKAMF